MKALHSLGLIVLFTLFTMPAARAGVFNLPRFVDVGNNAFGFEPEVTLTNSGGVAGSVRYTQGITELNNLHLILGTGTGQRQFRVGTAVTFDFIPDVELQPGFGVALQSIYYRYRNDRGQMEVAAVPYLHKTFSDGAGNRVEPFIAIPFGPAFYSGDYHWTTQIALGAIYHPAGAKTRFVSEVGVSVNKTESYISGGILFEP